MLLAGMSVGDYQANWRGARRYRFDKEARLKKAAGKKVLPWRRIKHGEPVKLKVLAEDIASRKRRFTLRSVLAGMFIVGAAAAGYTADQLPLDRFRALLPGSGCNIKGNISHNGHIYHVPGQKYYHETRVSVLRGERWFCSEADARKAGWRRARV